MSDETKTMTDDERLTLDLFNAGRRACGLSALASWGDYDGEHSEVEVRRWYGGVLAKARELLAQPAQCEPLTEDERAEMVRIWIANHRELTGLEWTLDSFAREVADRQRAKMKPPPALPTVEELVNQSALDAKLDELQKLPANWDGYKASRISPGAAARVYELLRSLHISPLPDGGLQIDMDEDFDVTVTPDGKVEAEPQPASMASAIVAAFGPKPYPPDAEFPTQPAPRTPDVPAPVKQLKEEWKCGKCGKRLEYDEVVGVAPHCKRCGYYHVQRVKPQPAPPAETEAPGLRERAENLQESITRLRNALDAAKAREETAERERDEARAQLTEATREAEKLREQLARGKVGLPAVGETVVVLADGQWQEYAVFQHQRAILGGDCPDGFTVYGVLGLYVLADEGKTWRRIPPAPTGEKGGGT